MDKKVQKLINSHKWDKIIELVKNGALVPNTKLNNGNNIIHYAAINNNSKLLKYLVKHNPNDLKYINDDGDTPIHLLAKFGYIDLLKDIIIIENGVLDLHNKYNETILHLLHNKEDFIKWIIHNVDDIKSIDVVDEDGMTLLTKSISEGNYKIPELLIKKELTDINYPDVLPPLNVAIYDKNYKVIDLLLENGADIDKKDQTFFSPLLIAISKKLPDVVQKLVEHGVDMTYTGPEGDHNPLIMAIKNNDEKSVNILLNNSFDFTKYDKNMNTPLHVALSMKDEISSTIIAKLLYFSDLNKKNIDGETPIKLLVDNHNWKNYNVFLENKNINMENYKNNKKEINNNTIKKVDRLKTNFGQFNSDSLHSMIYMMIILKKYKNLAIPIQFKIPDKVMNGKLNNFCNNMYKDPHGEIISDLVKIYSDYCFEILPYLMIWRNDDQYFIADNLDYYINKCLVSDNVRFMVIKLTLVVSTNGTHANIIIFDKKTGILERFEPYGAVPYLDPEKLDNKVNKIIGGIIKNITGKRVTYCGPKDILNNISFQSISNDGKSAVKKLGDPFGYCLAWTLWYLESRIKNPEKTPKELIKIHLEKILEASNDKTKFIDFIRDYANRLDKDKNEYMLKAGIAEKNLYNLMLKDDDQNKIIDHLSADINKIANDRL